MKKSLLVLSLLVWALIGATSLAEAGGTGIEDLKKITHRFPFTVILERDGELSDLFIYANINQNIHVYSLTAGKLKLEWQSTNLGSQITSLLAQDLYQDGRPELVFSTAAGRIVIYDLETYSFVWENLQDRFEEIECLTAANIDNDIQAELIFVADSYLYIYDSHTKGLEWRSQDEVSAREILVANVDDDDQPEIILSSGIILDSKFYNVDLEAEIDFGERISLIDINGDGFPEVIGEIGKFSLRVFDIYGERVLW
jgi:hypothetical protein